MSDQVASVKELEDIYSKSVTANDQGQVFANGGIIRMVMPFFAPGQSPNQLLIPPQPPLYWSFQRDFVLRATVNNEAMWAAAIGIAITKMASLSFNIDSAVPARAKRAQEIFLGADGDRTGWVAFLSKHLRDFLTTDNGAFVEIVRESSTLGSKIVGIRHLDSVRCTRTGDPEIPVVFRDRKNKYHELKDHQVICLSDMPDPGDLFYGVGLCAASRAYNAIYKLSTIEWYLREKVGGLRPLAIYIVNGILDKQIRDAIGMEQQEQISRGVAAYMGATIVAIPGDKTPGMVSIPLAELPDRFARKEEFDISLLTYADAIGLDLQDLQPLSAGGLGTATQSQVLDNKGKGKGLSAWRQDWTHAVDTYILDDLTTFMFVEKDYRDQEAAANVSKARADVAKVRIETGITSADQERQIMVDMDELPKEFLSEDVTPGDSVSDTEKPEKDEAEKTGAAVAKPEDLKNPAEEGAQEGPGQERPGAQDAEAPQDKKSGQKPAQGQRQASKEYDGTGIMVAAFVPDNIAEKIALDCPGALDPEDLHITLAFLGDTESTAGDVREQAMKAVGAAAQGAGPIRVEISGVGRFLTGEADGKQAFYASVDSLELKNLREAVEKSLKTMGVPMVEAHGFTPHITLAYLEPDQETPEFDLPEDSAWVMDGITLAWGHDRDVFEIPQTETKATKGAVEEATSIIRKIMDQFINVVRPKKKKETTLKHLAGQHDQKTHGHRGGGPGVEAGGSSGGRAMAPVGSHGLLSEDQRVQVHAQVKRQMTEKGRTWSSDRRDYLYKYIEWVSGGKKGDPPSPQGDATRAANHIRRLVESNPTIKALGLKAERRATPKPKPTPKPSETEAGKKPAGGTVKKTRAEIAMEKLESIRPKIEERELFIEKLEAQRIVAAEKANALGRKQRQYWEESGRLMSTDREAAEAARRKGNEMVPDIRAAVKDYDDITAAYKAEREKGLLEVADALKVDDPISVEVEAFLGKKPKRGTPEYGRYWDSYSGRVTPGKSSEVEVIGGLSKNREKAIRDGLEAVQKITSKSAAGQPDDSLRIDAGSGGSRASCAGNRIYIQSGGTLTMIHEMGHFVEHTVPGAYAKARAFLERRTAGEKMVHIPGLPSGEFGRLDKFMEPYMGKHYPKSTEIISMGFQMLFSQPLKFMKTDPDYFAFIISLIQGE